MAQDDELKRFGIGAGLNQDDSPEDVDRLGDYVNAVNLRNTGTGSQQAGYNTNIESFILLAGSLLPGINQIIGGGKFDDTGQILAFRYNSGQKCQMLLYDAVAKTYKVIYTDQTDSDGEVLLPLDPQKIVLAILINKTFAVWWAEDLEVGYCNLNTLATGGYGTVLAEDLSLLKPQCLIPPTGVYGDDAGQPANFLFGNLPQFSVQYVNADFNYSTWSTWSKRIVPYQQNTPTLGSDVTKNNYIIVSVNIGSIRASTINIAYRFGTQIFSIVKSVDRSYVIALPFTSVSVATQVYEAYDPTTNLYSFVYYNNEIAIPVDPNETDLFVDYIYPSNAGEKINGNIIALGDFKTLYNRPNISVSVNAIGYDPNIDIPAGTYPNPLIKTGSDPGESGSGAGDHKRKISVSLGGIPHTGDKIIVIISDIRNANATINYTYVVPSSQDGNLDAVVGSFSELIPGSNFYNNGDGTDTVKFVGPPYYGLQVFSIQLFFAGASVANSIPTVLDNTSYQLALEYRDKWGRPFPLDTNNTFIVPTPSYAQVSGQAVEITMQILTASAPIGAVDYQVLVTKPPIDSLLDVNTTLLDYKGSWNAKTNSPTLAVNVGTVGDTFQITTPNDPSQPDYTNLGNGATYNTGDYVTYNGQSWAVLPKEFGDLTSTGNILAFSLNPLNLFNSEYAEEGVSTVLGYDFSVGDRCTLHYYIDGSGDKVFINNPCVNLSVFGYDAGNFIVKVEKSATFDTSVLSGKNTFLRLYSPAQQSQTVSTTQNGTVWYEIGQRYTITNGLHDTLAIVINDGGAYYKTRQYADALNPYTSAPIETLSTDFNYSDFYPSAFSSFGRPRTYYDVLEPTEREASIITSQNYVLGSKNNGLNRFYPENIYGDGDGQCSSSQGPIQIMWQRGDVLVVIQQLNVFYIPVNIAYTQLNDQITGQSISEKLLNNGRYATEGVGIGTAKESFWTRYDRGGFVDPYTSLPYELTLSGIEPIPRKMSKFFKSTLQAAYSLGKKLYQFYNDYYEEVILCIQASGGILILFPFNDTDWNANDSYVIVPGDVTATPNGAHSTASYDDTTGLVTYTPEADYVGNDSATFTFNTIGGLVTKNNCLTWLSGNSNINLFSFTPITGVDLSTLELSNIIGVDGNDIPVPISITGGEYSINGGAFTSSAGTVNNGDNVQVRQTSASSSLTETDAVLTISTTSGTFKVTTGKSSVDAFAFTAQTGVPLSTVRTSNTITISGNTIPAPISITGGTYSKNGGDYVSTPGSVNAGDTVTVRQTSSASPSTLTTANLTIDIQTQPFNVTTGTSAVNPFSFTPQTGVAQSTVITSNTINPTGNTLPSAISISSGGQYSLNGGGFTSSAGTFNPGDSVAVRQTSSASLNTTTSVTLTIDAQSAAFTVKTIAPAATVNGSLTEQVAPAVFVDADLIIKDGATAIITLTSTGSDSTTIAADDLLTAIVRSTIASTGINPQLHMRVYRNVGSGDVLIFSSDIPQTSTSEIDWSGESAVSGATYTIQGWSDSNAVIDWSNNQQLTPFIDSDLLIYDLTTTYVNETDNNSGTFNAPAGDLLHVLASNNIAPIGSTSPKIRLQITDNDGSVFDSTIDATGSVSIPEDITLKGGYLYYISASTFDASGGESSFTVANDTFATTINYVAISGTEGTFNLSNTVSGGSQTVPIPNGTDYVVQANLNPGQPDCNLTVNGVTELLPGDGSIITFPGTFTAPINAGASDL